MSYSIRLLVDGYNIIGASTHLTKLRENNNLAASRQQLTELLVNYSALQDYKTEVVFDAYEQQTPVYREEITKNLSVCYTGYGETADTYIERTCASFCKYLSALSPRLLVATSDRAQRLTVVGYGAEWMSAKQLVHDLETTVQQVRVKHKPKARSRGRYLFNALDPQSQQRLTQLQKGEKL